VAVFLSHRVTVLLNPKNVQANAGMSVGYRMAAMTLVIYLTSIISINFSEHRNESNPDPVRRSSTSTIARVFGFNAFFS
jgi:hypothetical protein